MTRFRCSETILNVFISNEEKITLNKAKGIIRKSRRMIRQNEATAIIVEFKDSHKIDKSALTFFNRVICYNSNFPVAIINS
mgnify:CR=1 FL=1|tara:strand:- start:871 stop:1113 length:243 start_codon:yes stop_codon:yes gene_type:complete